MRIRLVAMRQRWCSASSGTDDTGRTAAKAGRAMPVIVSTRWRLSGLLKRSVSTIGTCVNTLRVVADRYGQAGEHCRGGGTAQKERARALRAYRKRVLRFGVLDAAAEGDVAELEADGMAADLHGFAAAELASTGRPRRRGADPTAEALDALIRLGDMAVPHDPKLAALADEVRSIRMERGHNLTCLYRIRRQSIGSLTCPARGAGN